MGAHDKQACEGASPPSTGKLITPLQNGCLPAASRAPPPQLLKRPRQRCPFAPSPHAPPLTGWPGPPPSRCAGGAAGRTWCTGQRGGSWRTERRVAPAAPPQCSLWCAPTGRAVSPPTEPAQPDPPPWVWRARARRSVWSWTRTRWTCWKRGTTARPATATAMPPAMTCRPATTTRARRRTRLPAGGRTARRRCVCRGQERLTAHVGQLWQPQPRYARLQRCVLAFIGRLARAPACVAAELLSWA